MSQSASNVSEAAWFDHWNTSYRAGDKLDPIASELFDRTAAVVNRITASGRCRVLEIACGTGTLSRELIYSNYQGLDISPAAIKVCLEKRENLPSPARFSSLYEVADIHDWP